MTGELAVKTLVRWDRRVTDQEGAGSGSSTVGGFQRRMMVIWPGHGVGDWLSKGQISGSSCYHVGSQAAMRIHQMKQSLGRILCKPMALEDLFLGSLTAPNTVLCLE